MNDTGYVAAECQKDIQPEMQAETDLQEDADGRQKDGDQNADDVQGGILML